MEAEAKSTGDRDLCGARKCRDFKLATCVDITEKEIAGLVRFAQEKQIDLTVVGPEEPLFMGIVDQFRAAGLTIYGPTKAAARIEGSKRFAKELMVKYQIPTPRYQAFEQADEALAYVRETGAPIVIKADGLAAGKGVILAETLEQAEAAIEGMMKERAFGDAGKEVVIEEFLVWSGDFPDGLCRWNGGSAHGYFSRS